MHGSPVEGATVLTRDFNFLGRFDENHWCTYREVYWHMPEAAPVYEVIRKQAINH
jgi:hypothetical protein